MLLIFTENIVNKYVEICVYYNKIIVINKI